MVLMFFFFINNNVQIGGNYIFLDFIASKYLDLY